MKIAIGINTYTSNLKNRQQMCMDALRKVKAKFNDIVELYNVQYEDDNFEFEGFTKLSKLKRKPYNILEEYFDHDGLIDLYNTQFKEHMPGIKDSRMVSVKEVIEVLSDVDCDKFVFINDDIVMSDRFIKTILDNPNYDCYPASRLHLFDFESLDGKFTPEAYSVHGFDGYCFTKEWWKKQQHNFPDYILGKPYWDTHYFTLCQLLGNAMTLNKVPAVLFHPEHQSTACTDMDVLARYNEDIFNRDLICKQLWFRYVYNVLLKRPTVGNIKWYQPFPNEVQLEHDLFKKTISLGIQPKPHKEFKPLELSKKEEFDAFLPCAPKDGIKLKFMVEGLIKNAIGLKDIHICTPKPIEKLDIDYPIYYHTDREVLPNINPFMWKFRPNWTFQQFLKLFQNVTNTEYYVTVDIDSVLSRPIHFFEDGHPVWHVGWRQNHLPYFLFNQYVMGLEKVKDHTYICDMNFFNKAIINQMIDVSGYTLDEFINVSYQIISGGCHIAEPEIYGNFAEKYYPGLYKYKKAKQYKFGKDHSANPNDVPWTVDEIKELIKGKEDYDMVQMHSWCISNGDHWK